MPLSAPQHLQHQPGLPCSCVPLPACAPNLTGLREGSCQDIREFLSWLPHGFYSSQGRAQSFPQWVGGEKSCTSHTNTTCDCSGSQTGPLVNVFCEAGAQEDWCHQTRIISPFCLFNLQPVFGCFGWSTVQRTRWGFDCFMNRII